MNYPKFLILSKGFLHLIRRFFLIIKRFGFSSKKIAKNLYILLDTVNKFGGKISLNITAVVLERHPALIKDLNEKGVVFGGHGYVHTNHRNLSLKKQIEGLKKTQEIFKRHNIPLYGFRAPYLSYNKDTLRAIDECGFSWSSNKVIDAEVLSKDKFRLSHWNTYVKLLDELYIPKSYRTHLSLPKYNSAYVEIPLIIPDDELMIDRLHMRSAYEIEEIWKNILTQSQKRGDLFVLQLHHERLKYYKQALEAILRHASNCESKVWLASLNDIAEWWKERSNDKIEFTSQGNNKYRVRCDCAPRSSVLIRNLKSSVAQKLFFNGYDIINESLDFIVESPVKPCIGLSPDSPLELEAFLKAEGFAFEVNHDKDRYGLYFDTYKEFCDEDELTLLTSIENSSSPLLRSWRWPDKYISALAITGDIDSITLWDFVARIFEF